MSKIMNEYGVIDRETVLEHQGLKSAVNKLADELKTFAEVFDLNGEEIHQLYQHFADEIICNGIGEKFRWIGKRRKEEERNELVEKLGLLKTGDLAKTIHNLSLDNFRELKMRVTKDNFFSVSHFGYSVLIKGVPTHFDFVNL